MPLTSPFGDHEISDPSALRALAHPVRLALLTHLQRHGPATATELSQHVDASPSVVSWHLRHLASFDLVADADTEDTRTDRRRRRWRATAPGFHINLRPDADSQAAARSLRAELVAAAEADVAAWMEDVEPHLDADWVQHAGPSNTVLNLTQEELAQLSDAINDLLAPFTSRRDAPTEARSVRMLRYYLPELAATRPGASGSGKTQDAPAGTDGTDGTESTDASGSDAGEP